MLGARGPDPALRVLAHDHRRQCLRNNSTGIMAPDGGDTSRSPTTSSSPAPTRTSCSWAARTSPVFVHNTVVDGDIHINRKSDSGTNSTQRDHPRQRDVHSEFNTTNPAKSCTGCTISYNLFSASGERQRHQHRDRHADVRGRRQPDHLRRLRARRAAGGKANASDGTDRGINTAARTRSRRPRPRRPRRRARPPTPDGRLRAARQCRRSGRRPQRARRAAVALDGSLDG